MIESSRMGIFCSFLMTSCILGGTDMNTEGKVLDRKRLFMIGIPALCVLIAAAIVIGIVLHNRDITAVTMRLQRLVGTVNLYNERGK